MLENLVNTGCLININNLTFDCEYDHKSIYILENITGKGFYKLYTDFIYLDNLSKNDVVSIFSVSAYKNHGNTGMMQLKNAILRKRKINIQEIAAFKLHFKSLLPDNDKLVQNLRYLNQKFTPSKHSSEFYDFEDSYALALKYLGWSDKEFWASTPHLLTFAIISLAKYEKERQKLLKKQVAYESIDLLKGIKNLL